MTRQAIIERTIQAINQLPEEKAIEISEFADFITQRYEEHKLTTALQEIASKSMTFEFLNDEEELYSESDLKERFNG